MNCDTIHTLSTEKLINLTIFIKKSKISLPETKNLFSLIICYTNSRAKCNFKFKKKKERKIYNHRFHINANWSFLDFPLKSLISI